MTNSGLSGAARKFRMGPSQRIMLLSATLAVVAVALFVIVVRHLPAAPTALSLPWVLWAGAFAVSEWLEVHVQWNRESHTFSASDLVLACGLILASPWTVVTAQVVGVGVTMIVHRKQRGVRLAFNLSQYALGGCLAVITWTGLDSLLGTTWNWIAALVGVGVATSTAALCIFAVMTLSEGRVQLRGLWEMLGFSVPFTLGSGAVGIVLARTAVHDTAALALLALPSLLIVAAYRAYMKARDQQENMRLLHEVTSLLHSNGDSHEALGDFLTSIRSAFRANLAELVLIGSTSADGATVSRSRENESPLVMEPATDAEDYARLLRLATPSGTLRTRIGSGRGRGSQLDAYVTERGFKDAMVAVLRTEDRVHGLLLVAGRFGDVTTFSQTDVALLETFARHVATSLERG